MSKPKLLKIFDDTTEDRAYSKFNNPITVTKDGNTLLVNTNVTISSNTMLTFYAPCNSSEVSTITANGIVYSLVDAASVSISEGGKFVSGSLVSVILDVTNLKAYVQNSSYYDPDQLILLANAITKGDGTVVTEKIISLLGINNKQDKITGTESQYVGFDAKGNLIAKDGMLTFNLLADYDQ